MSLRIWARIKQRLVGWDDFFIVLSIAFVTAASVMTCEMPEFGLGKHFWTLEEEHQSRYFKYVWACNIFYTAATSFIKLAILFQYLRLFDITSNDASALARKLTTYLLVATIVWGTAYTFLALFSCTPIQKNWDIHLPGKCFGWGSKDPDHFFPAWAVHAAMNMFLDVLVFLLPLPFLRRLRMAGKTRAWLWGLFFMGGIVVSLSIARLISLSIRRLGTVPVFDPTFATPLAYVTSVLEVNMAIICASIPIFWPLVTATLGMNKILVVNEIVVRTDSCDSTRGVGLGEQGANVGTAGTNGLQALHLGSDGRASQLETKVSAKDTVTTTVFGKGTAGYETPKNTRNASRCIMSGLGRHRTKVSNSSNNALFGIELGRRVSQESERELRRQQQHPDKMSLSSFSSAKPTR